MQQESLEIWRKRLRFRSWHRGMKEMDIILGSFADEHLEDFDADQLAVYERLLAVEDPVIFDWMRGRAKLPEEFQGPVGKLLLNYKLPDINR